MRLSACKKEASICLKNRKLRAFRISLCIGAVGFLSGVCAFFLPQFFSECTQNRLWTLIGQTASGVLSYGLLGTLRQGSTAWLYCSACGKEPSSVQFLFWLRKGRGLRAAYLHTVLFLRKAIWTILLSAPGIAVLICAVVWAEHQTKMIRFFTWSGGAFCLAVGLLFAGIICQKYSLAPILFAKSPEKGIRSAVRGSCFLMDGDCMRLYLLKLSFLPWTIPCLTVLPLIFVLPYYKQSKTCMLRGILRAHTL